MSANIERQSVEKQRLDSTDVTLAQVTAAIRTLTKLSYAITTVTKSGREKLEAAVVTLQQVEHYLKATGKKVNT